MIKNRNGALIPVRPDLAIQIRAWISETNPIPTDSASAVENRCLFKVPTGLDKIFNKDIALAGIPKTDNRGYVADVHGLRTTFCSMLSKAGILPKTVQLAMRHGSIDLTMETYTDPALLDLHTAVAALPLANRRKMVIETYSPTQLAPVLAPDGHKGSTEQPLSANPAEATNSDDHRSSFVVTSSPDNRKASLSFADNEALPERVRGIEPPPEAWEASVLPLNYTRNSTALSLTSRCLQGCPVKVLRLGKHCPTR